MGVVGGLIIGMVTRTAQRPAPGARWWLSAPEVGAYVLVLSAAVLRAVVPAVQPFRVVCVHVGSIPPALWALAFVLYLVVYTPWLLRARVWMARTAESIQHQIRLPTQYQQALAAILADCDCDCTRWRRSARASST